jgi:hypothetical protein
METISQYCGCLPCLLVGITDVHTTIEHVTEAGRRVGGEEQHQHTIGLCEWHHFARLHGGLTRQQASGIHGPSLAWGRKTFEEFFGDELKVLIPVQDFMLEQFAALPWPEYSVPRTVARRVRLHWIELKNAEPSQSLGRSSSNAMRRGQNTD